MRARFAVVACSACHAPWATELRHGTAACPRCAKPNDLAGRRRLWEGDDARDAQEAAALQRAIQQGLPAPEAARLGDGASIEARHDSPLDAAAAQAAGITNKSERAEAVALWLTRLSGGARHDELVAALEKAGIARPRAEAEVVRMLAMDHLFEPRAGWLRTLQG